MLTFKKTLHDANVAFEKAVDDREHTIKTLLTLFKLDYGQSRKQRLTYAISKLDAANNHLVKVTDELVRLKHIETVTDLIASPFPAHIAEQMRAAGISEEDQRDLANELLADETPAGEPPRSWLKGDWAIHEPEPRSDDARHCAICGGPTGEGHRCADDDDRTDLFDDDADLAAMDKQLDDYFHPTPAETLTTPSAEHHRIWFEEAAEMPDAPWLRLRAAARRGEWLKADIGSGFVEYRPGTLLDAILDSSLSDIEKSMTDAERPSLHGDGHVGPVAQHAKEVAEQLGATPSLHDLLEALASLDELHADVKRIMGGGRRPMHEQPRRSGGEPDNDCEQEEGA